MPVCFLSFWSQISDSKFNITAMNGSSITIAANTMMRNHEDQFWPKFSNHASGKIGMPNCCDNLVTKSKNGTIRSNRETDVNFLAVVASDFILWCFNHENCIHLAWRTTSRAFCCADILCSFSRELLLIKDRKLMVDSKARLCSFSWDCSWLAIYRWGYILKPA